MRRFDLLEMGDGLWVENFTLDWDVMGGLRDDLSDFNGRGDSGSRRHWHRSRPTGRWWSHDWN
jgi:hypothetical protein